MSFQWPNPRPNPGQILGGLTQPEHQKLPSKPKNWSKIGQNRPKIGQNRRPELARGQKTSARPQTGQKKMAQPDPDQKKSDPTQRRPTIVPCI